MQEQTEYKPGGGELRVVPDHALDRDWDSIKWFTPNEFPKGSLENIEAKLIYFLDGYRDLLDEKVIPSPVAAGWYRFDGSMTSRHYAVRRLSDAGDVFPQCDIRKALVVAMGCPWWGGIGVYLDTTGPSGKPEPMLHLDLRPRRVLWMRVKENGKERYIYPLRSKQEMQDYMRYLTEWGEDDG